MAKHERALLFATFFPICLPLVTDYLPFRFVHALSVLFRQPAFLFSESSKTLKIIDEPV